MTNRVRSKDLPGKLPNPPIPWKSSSANEKEPGRQDGWSRAMPGGDLE
jgi:hypothetical protein